MRTAGVDLSVADKGTAAAIVEWEEGSEDRARVGEPSSGLDDAALLDLLAEAQWTAIDAPFGWPAPMVAAVHAYAVEDRWPAPDKQSFRLRRTDLHVHDRVLADTGEKLWPLSPSTDRISLTAWRLAGLREAAYERSRIRFDRAGGDRVVEAYPAAALLLWELPRRPRIASSPASRAGSTCRGTASRSSPPIRGGEREKTLDLRSRVSNRTTSRRKPHTHPARSTLPRSPPRPVFGPIARPSSCLAFAPTPRKPLHKAV